MRCNPRASGFQKFACLIVPLAAWLAPAASPAADDLDGLGKVYDTLAALDSGPVIVFLDTQHPDVVREELGKSSGHPAKLAALQEKLAALAGVRCALLHHTQVKPADFDRPNIKALLVGPRKRGIRKELDEELFALIRDTRIPTIGFSTAQSLVAQAYGGKSGLMRDLKPGEEDAKPDFWPGKFKIWGPGEVKILKPDALFDGVAEAATFYEYHAFEIKDLPADFDVLATSAECRFQAIKHRNKVLYGTQFRPELWDERLPDGEIVLRNFFKLAGLGVR